MPSTSALFTLLLISSLAHAEKAMRREQDGEVLSVAPSDKSDAKITSPTADRMCKKRFTKACAKCPNGPHKAGWTECCGKKACSLEKMNKFCGCKP